MNVFIGQVILVVIILMFILYITRVRTVLFDRLIMLFSSIVAMILIINPNISTQLAHLMGIGRGTDMILYFFILFVLFQFVGIAVTRRSTDKKITKIIRAMALRNPESEIPPIEGEIT